MKRYLRITLLSIVIVHSSIAQNAKIVSDCTVVYDVTVVDAKLDPEAAKAMAGATKTLYLKGSKTRSELTTPNFQQTIIYDSKTDSTIILSEFGNTKYLSFLNADKRTEKNKKFEGVTFSSTNETKKILEYDCRKMIAKLKDGSTYNIYYAPAIIPSNKDYEYQFRDLPGLVLEYETESENGKLRVNYIATKITTTPVATAKFDIPKSGYRIL